MIRGVIGWTHASASHRVSWDLCNERLPRDPKNQRKPVRAPVLSLMLHLNTGKGHAMTQESKLDERDRFPQECPISVDCARLTTLLLFPKTTTLMASKYINSAVWRRVRTNAYELDQKVLEARLRKKWGSIDYEVKVRWYLERFPAVCSHMA